jgi:hypothetical protein
MKLQRFRRDRVRNLKSEQRVAFGTTKATKKTSCGSKQDRDRAAGGQDCEVKYARKTGRSSAALKKAAMKGWQQS